MSLKIGVVRTPFVRTCSQIQDCPHRGYTVDAAIIICKFLKLNCTFHWYENYDYGTVLRNGTSTGMIGAIQRGEFDTSIPDFTPTFDRLRAIDFSNLIDVNDMVLVTRSPSPESSEIDWSGFHAFTWSVWIIFIILWLLTGFASILIQKFIASQNTESHKNFFILYLDICRSLILNQFSNENNERKSMKFLTQTWSVCFFVLTSTYSGCLFSRKVSQKPDLPFTDMESFVQCLEKTLCTLVTPDLSASFIQDLISPNSTYGARVEASRTYNPFLIALLFEETKKKILETKNRYLVAIGPKPIIFKWINENKNCQFFVMDMPSTELMSFPLPKNFSLLEKINEATLLIQENGITTMLKRKIGVFVDLCQQQQQQKQNKVENVRDEIPFRSVAVVFGLYCIGMAIAVVEFGVEICVRNIKKI